MNVGTTMLVPCAVNVAVEPSGPRATIDIVASNETPAVTAALQEARLTRIVGGPGGFPASTGQMTCSLSPAASVASTVPSSTGTGTARAPNASDPPVPVTGVVVPDSTTSAVPEMIVTAGAAVAVQAPILSIQPSGTSPIKSMRRRPVRNWGTFWPVRTTAPPSPFIDLHGSEAATASVAVSETPL